MQDQSLNETLAKIEALVASLSLRPSVQREPLDNQIADSSARLVDELSQQKTELVVQDVSNSQAVHDELEILTAGMDDLQKKLSTRQSELLSPVQDLCCDSNNVSDSAVAVIHGITAQWEATTAENQRERDALHKELLSLHLELDNEIKQSEQLRQKVGACMIELGLSLEQVLGEKGPTLIKEVVEFKISQNVHSAVEPLHKQIHQLSSLLEAQTAKNNSLIADLKMVEATAKEAELRCIALKNQATKKSKETELLLALTALEEASKQRRNTKTNTSQS